MPLLQQKPVVSMGAAAVLHGTTSLEAGSHCSAALLQGHFYSNTSETMLLQESSFLCTCCVPYTARSRGVLLQGDALSDADFLDARSRAGSIGSASLYSAEDELSPGGGSSTFWDRSIFPDVGLLLGGHHKLLARPSWGAC